MVWPYIRENTQKMQHLLVRGIPVRYIIASPQPSTLPSSTMSQPLDLDSRLGTELALLEAMYPSQITFNAHSRDLIYTHSTATLHLRLPETYPSSGHPSVLSASDLSKIDIRDVTKASLHSLDLAEGEEALDAIIASFQTLLQTNDDSLDADADTTHSSRDAAKPSAVPDKTVIIWLHHLLATSKRKLAISPASPLVRGITKPGYPGIMVFSGPRDVVDEHVGALKSQRWQAFSVRYEEEGERWLFWGKDDPGGGGGGGVKEVETMGEIVKGVGEGRKEVFLKAVGIV